MDVFELQAKVDIDMSAFDKKLADTISGAKKIADSFKGASDGIDYVGRSLNNTTNYIEGYQREASAAEKSTESITDAFADWINGSGSLSDALSVTANKVGDMITHVPPLANGINSLADRMSGLSSSSNGLLRKLGELASGMANEKNASLNTADAQKELEKRIREATQGITNEAEKEEIARRITMEYQKEIGDAANSNEKLKKATDDAAKASKSASSEHSKLASVLGTVGEKALSAAANVAKITAGAVAAGGGAVAKLAKDSLDSYASFEQLKGGVETLFGAQGMSIEDYAQSVGKSVKAVQSKYDQLMKAQADVMANADNAYKTAGLSANAYMETVTSFSASLLQGLGGDTVKAAAEADIAIRDMSDNANKMGTSIEMIQNAYQGFAKQNFTMLDNLNNMGAFAV